MDYGVKAHAKRNKKDNTETAARARRQRQRRDRPRFLAPQKPLGASTKNNQRKKFEKKGHKSQWKFWRGKKENGERERREKAFPKSEPTTERTAAAAAQETCFYALTHLAPLGAASLK